MEIDPTEHVANQAAPIDNKRIQELCARLQQIPDARSNQVDALAMAVREGRYSISPEQIAQSILSNMYSGFI